MDHLDKVIEMSSLEGGILTIVGEAQKFLIGQFIASLT